MLFHLSVDLWAFYFVALMYLHIPVLISHCLDSYVFIIILIDQALSFCCSASITWFSWPFQEAFKILLYLKSKKLAHHGFMDDDIRHETPE